MPDYITLRKLSATSAPYAPTPNAEEYEAGRWNGGVENKDVSVPVDYTVTGWLQSPATVGRGLFIARDSRNGIKAMGLMKTSAIQNIEPKENGLILSTENSVYDLTWTDPPEEENVPD